MNTEEILWQAIKDIESGNAKTTKEDPVDGWLNEKAKKGLTKINVCAQSAKYNLKNGNKPITRPTLDTYPKIVGYINVGSGKSEDDVVKKLRNENKILKEENEKLKSLTKELKEGIEAIAIEKYKLNEKLKITQQKSLKE